MSVVYLQRSFSIEGNINPIFKNTILDHFDQKILKTMIVDLEEEDMKKDPDVSMDLIAIEDCEKSNPELIYCDGGLFYQVGDQIHPKIPINLIEKLVTKGTIVIIADVDYSNAEKFWSNYQENYELLGFTFLKDGNVFGKNVNIEPGALLYEGPEWLKDLCPVFSNLSVKNPINLNLFENSETIYPFFQ